MMSKSLSVIFTVTALVCVVQGFVHKLDTQLKAEYNLQTGDLEAYKRSFVVFDYNNDLYITQDEVEIAFKSLGEQVQHSHITTLRSNDKNGDGKIDLDEFIFISRKDANVDFVFSKLFKTIDVNSSGSICSSELQKWLASLGKNVETELAEKYVQIADGSQDGHLTYMEVLYLLKTLTHGLLKP